MSTQHKFEWTAASAKAIAHIAGISLIASGSAVLLPALASVALAPRLTSNYLESGTTNTVSQRIAQQSATRPTWHNCLSREAWTPDKQAWCAGMQQLRNAEYPISNLVPNRPTVRLTNGIYENRAETTRVNLINLPGLLQLTDATGDQKADGVVILSASTGGSGAFTYLSIAPEQNGRLQPSSTVFLGDRVRVEAVQVQGSQIRVTLLTQGPNDPMCCPTVRQTRVYELRNNQLALMSQPSATGQLSAGTTGQNSRSGYAPIDLSSLPAESRDRGASPSTLALAAFQLPIEEAGNIHQQVIVDQTSPNQVVVTIVQMGLGDDSVRGARYRTEFERDSSTSNPLWRMVWAGRQQACQPGRGEPGWSSANCL